MTVWTTWRHGDKEGEGQSMVPLCIESGSTGTGDKAGQNGSVDCFLNTEGTVRAVKYKALFLCLWRDDTSEWCILQGKMTSYFALVGKMFDLNK